ncbi:2TM domain-containing protein [Christiangramia salexigens]|uniref:Histidine kinase n=1 Tax=Christiangramia salexigens TaxID=1913577 RepID=A0A1L3J3R8_9FLAO|nr:2TM domain-containing protein [Christiangramia salexigens]APG59771.1 histidine kinase [Christiangramia salexigens]
MKHLLKIFKITISICLILILLDTTFNGFKLAKLGELEYWGTYLFYSFVITFLNSYYFLFFAKRIGWEGASLKRVFIATGGSVLVTLIGFFFCRIVVEVLFKAKELESFLDNERIAFYFLPFLLTLIVSLFFHLVYFYKALQEKKVKEQKIIAGTASAKFDALKNQLDPHFLFNSLNVLASLIDENPEQAQKFTTALSKVYRYVLEQKEKELVSLSEELKFASTYINLLKMRFEDSIFFELPNAPASDDAKVVPLSLQLLLENTIKHNIVNEAKPLRIKIYVEGDYLVVENNYQKKEVLSNRKGVGLQNIVNRYAVLTKRNVLIDENSETFKVKLPILTQQITIMETNENMQENAYIKAKQRVKEIKDFYGNLITYCIVMPFLIFINYYSYWDYQWFWFPLFGWGIGLTIHGFSVFGYGSDWEERKIKELMDKENHNIKTWK